MLMSVSGTTGPKARSAPKRAASKRAAPKRDSAKRTSSKESSNAGRIGGALRGSMNSVMGTVGLNVPLRAIERLTGAVEHAATVLERVERATRHLDARFFDRVNDSFAVLADLRKDTRAIRARVDEVEADMRELQLVLTERLDRVPLIRPSRRARKAKAAGENGE